MSYVAAYVTAKNLKEARKIAGILVKGRLVACANIIPKIESIYNWKGKTEHSTEALIIAKTRTNMEDAIINTVKKHHSYEVPCVTFLPITKGSPQFLQWVEEETRVKYKKERVI